MIEQGFRLDGRFYSFGQIDKMAKKESKRLGISESAVGSRPIEKFYFVLGARRHK